MTHVPLTAALGDFVANLRYEDIPATAVAIAKQGIADCVGVMLAGSAEPAVAAVRRGFAPDTAGGGSSICFGPERAPAHVAAWVNGTAAHVLDYDDVALKGSHPSAVLVPAILAEAEAVGASGRDMLRAYAAGFETWGELISRDRGNYQRKGWHPTGVFGAVGAAAACAALRGATAQEAAHALGIAASQASGVMANLGFMTKPMHAGKAAACGLLAARFAAAGLTAAPNAIEHEQGYLGALSPPATSTANARRRCRPCAGAWSSRAWRSSSIRSATARTARSTPCSGSYVTAVCGPMPSGRSPCGSVRPIR